MKSIFILLFMVSGAFAQVDSVYTQQKIITGDIIGVNRVEICIGNYTFDKLWIPIEKVDRLVVKSGEVIIGVEASEKGYELFIKDYKKELPENMKYMLKDEKPYK